MANARSANIHYVDTTGVLTTKRVFVAGVVVTATAASAIVNIQDSAGTNSLLNLRVATSGETEVFTFSAPLVFPNGIKVSTLTNAIASVIYTNTSD